MSTEPSDDSSEKFSTTSVSGGVNVDAQHDVNIGGDVVGRDKIMSAGDDIVMGDQVEAETYIEHATIVNDRTNRIWLAALAGVVGVIVVVLGIIATRSVNTPAPVLTVIIPTNVPTDTPAPSTPTPTATPIFAEKVLYRVAIARFNQLSDRKLAIEQRLQDDLDQQLQAAGLSDEVEVKVVSQPAVESAQDAAKLAEATQSSVVIWGLYDDVGIRLRVSLGSSASLSQTVPEVARFGELPLASTGSETNTLSFYVTSTLPANTSFLSFYVLGHLYYLSNQYAKGHTAFDTAVQQLPKTVAVENAALLHFFNARGMNTTTFADAVMAICEYSRAIASDDRMFEAYNNLGTLVVKHELSLSLGMPAEQSEQLKSCTGQDVVRLDARELFSAALRIKPDLGIAEYNLGMLDWNTKARCEISAICEGNPKVSQSMLQNRERAESRFEAAVKLDASIPGAYLGIGNMAMWREDYVLATKHFSTALGLMPHSPEVTVNLGQALVLSGHVSDAEAAYQSALRNATENSPPGMEAHLALGNLYLRQGNLARAHAEYKQVQRAQTNNLDFDPSAEQFNYYQTGYYAATALNLALTQYEIDAGNWISASQQVQQLQQGRKDYESATGGFNQQTAELDTYLAWLVEAARAHTTTVEAQGPYTVTTDTSNSPFISWSYGNVATMAWHDLVKRCKTIDVDDFRTWGSSTNPCLPADPQQRLDAVFVIIQRRMQQRLFFTDVVPAGGMACPYIYTYEEQSHQWSLDTTILYQLVGPQAETTQARRLSHFDGRLLLREVESETSYVDMIAVRMITTDGREIALKLNDPLLGAADGHYFVLKQGNQRLLTFDVPEGALPAREVWVVAAGYYIPIGP